MTKDRIEGVVGASPAQRGQHAIARGEPPYDPFPEGHNLHPSLEGKLAPRIKLGSGLGKEALVTKIIQGGRNFSSLAKDVVARSKQEAPIKKDDQIHWGVVTVGDLVETSRNESYATTDEIYEAIRAKGLRELSVLESLEIIDDMENQPRGDVVRMAHEPVSVSRRGPEVLTVPHDNGRWVDSDGAGPGDRWSLGLQFAVGLRK